MRLGSGEVSPIEDFEGGFWCRKLCKTTRGKGSVFIFLGFEPRCAGVGARATKVSPANNAWGVTSPPARLCHVHSMLLSMAEPGSSDRNESFRFLTSSASKSSALH